MTVRSSLLELRVPFPKLPVVRFVTTGRSACSALIFTRPSWLVSSHVPCTQHNVANMSSQLNASIHHASPQAIQRGMRDFGKGLIAAAKTQIVEQMTTADLDELMPLLLSKASVAFYDKCLEERLRTIDAKRLINALARAERLGYEPSDVTEVQDDEQDTAHSAKHPNPPSQPVSVTPAPANPGPLPHCGICFRRFPAQSAFDHHVKMKVCTALPSTPGGFKYNCQHCGQGFTTPMGLQYVSVACLQTDLKVPTCLHSAREACLVCRSIDVFR